jgi:Peptidase A4 family
MEEDEVMVDRAETQADAALPHSRMFKLPPRDFDVRAASARDLLPYGIPRRPNPETHPVLAAKWSRLAAQQFEFIEPELQTAPFERRMDLALIERRRLLQEELARYDVKELIRDRGQLLFDLTKFLDSHPADILKSRIDLSALLALLPETSNIWSGAYVKRPVAEPIVTVTGQWNVSGVNPPLSARTASGFADGTYLCVAWVGIDGTAGSTDVLQAGTGSQALVQGGKFVSTSFFAWAEWFSLPWFTVANFPVHVGDQISCTVCAPIAATNGSAIFNNLTTGLTTIIPINPPSGTSLSGNVAEWIVEDPSTVSGSLYPFPNYGSTFFTGCASGTKNFELNLSNGKELDMVQGGVTLSSGVIQNKSTLWCHDGP